MARNSLNNAKVGPKVDLQSLSMQSLPQPQTLREAVLLTMAFFEAQGMALTVFEVWQNLILWKAKYYEVDNVINTDPILKKKKKARIVDEYTQQMTELTHVLTPSTLNIKSDSRQNRARTKSTKSLWVYYPWHNCLVHILSKSQFERLRTSRNRNLIFPNEQEKFRKFRIGIAGLNVGNPAAVCIALEGGGYNMKFADNDVLDLSNLNRFRTGICALGINKAILSARQVYEINPFAKIKVYENGITQENLETFLNKPKVDVLIEEMDNLDLKIKIRQYAQRNKIPVVMVTGNAEDVIIDIERYDIDKKLPILNGLLKKDIINDIEKMKYGQADLRAKIRIARDFMGSKFLSHRLKQSFPLVGIKLAGIPQLAESSFLRGATLCNIVRRLSVGEKLPSGRYNLRLSTIAK